MPDPHDAQQEVTPLEGHERGEGWHLGDAVGNRSRTVATVIAGLLVLVAAAAAVNGAWPAAGLLLAIAVGAAVLRLGRDPMSRTPQLAEGEGVLLPARPARPVVLVTWLLLGLLLSVSGVALALDQLVSAGAPDRAEVTGAVLAGGVALLLGMVVLGATWSGVRHRSTPRQGLLLRPDALVLRTQAKPVVLPWESITRVRPHWSRQRARGVTVAVRSWLSIEVAPPLARGESTALSAFAGTGTVPTVDIEAVAVPPGAVLELCRSYLEHPERRDELATSQGLRRLAEACERHREREGVR
ncbi:hypothetical protein GCM10023226_03700 [Nocardioides nanhaiensis]|uniref:Uncharacterized protein n=1 Tax=Nocardioides nanhaiensis TaxID=1476871 RepID=A0ABP8VTL5_9ACTN